MPIVPRLTGQTVDVNLLPTPQVRPVVARGLEAGADALGDLLQAHLLRSDKSAAASARADISAMVREDLTAERPQEPAGPTPTQPIASGPAAGAPLPAAAITAPDPDASPTGLLNMQGDELYASSQGRQESLQKRIEERLSGMGSRAQGFAQPYADKFMLDYQLQVERHTAKSVESDLRAAHVKLENEIVLAGSGLVAAGESADVGVNIATMMAEGMAAHEDFVQDMGTPADEAQAMKVELEREVLVATLNAIQRGGKSGQLEAFDEHMDDLAANKNVDVTTYNLIKNELEGPLRGERVTGVFDSLGVPAQVISVLGDETQSRVAAKESLWEEVSGAIGKNPSDLKAAESRFDGVWEEAKKAKQVRAEDAYRQASAMGREKVEIGQGLAQIRNLGLSPREEEVAAVMFVSTHQGLTPTGQSGGIQSAFRMSNRGANGVGGQGSERFLEVLNTIGPALTTGEYNALLRISGDESFLSKEAANAVSSVVNQTLQEGRNESGNKKVERDMLQAQVLAFVFGEDMKGYPDEDIYTFLLDVRDSREWVFGRWNDEIEAHNLGDEEDLHRRMSAFLAARGEFGAGQQTSGQVATRAKAIYDAVGTEVPETITPDATAGAAAGVSGFDPTMFITDPGIRGWPAGRAMSPSEREEFEHLLKVEADLSRNSGLSPQDFAAKYDLRTVKDVKDLPYEVLASMEPVPGLPGATMAPDEPFNVYKKGAEPLLELLKRLPLVSLFETEVGEVEEAEGAVSFAHQRVPGPQGHWPKSFDLFLSEDDRADPSFTSTWKTLQEEYGMGPKSDESKRKLERRRGVKGMYYFTEPLGKLFNSAADLFGEYTLEPLAYLGDSFVQKNPEFFNPVYGDKSRNYSSVADELEKRRDLLIRMVNDNPPEINQIFLSDDDETLPWERAIGDDGFLKTSLKTSGGDAGLTYVGDEVVAGERYLLDYHRRNLSDPLVDEKGTTTINITGVTGPGGRIYNVPGYWDGKRRNAKQARARAAKEGWENYPSYGSGEEANAAARHLHRIIEDDMERAGG